MNTFLSQSIAEINDNLRGKTYRLHKSRPYMKRREQEILEEVMIKLKPHKCIEFGAGFSTLHFPDFLPEGGKWISVEDNQEWYSRIREKNTRPHVELHWINMKHYPVATKETGMIQDMDDYLEVGKQEAPFDLMLIDGRQRVMCLDKSLEMLSEKGVVILHDANRRFYQRNLPKVKYQLLFTDFRRNAGGIWLGSPSRPLEEVLTVKKHQQKWGLLQNKFAKILNI